MTGRDRPRGQALVEFALVAPLFVLMLVGLFDIGRAVYAFNTVNNAAREGGRLAIVDQYEAHIRAEAAGAATNLGVDAADISIAYELEDGSACPHVGTAGISLCVAVVTVPYQYEAATPIIGNLIGPILIRGESRFPISVACSTSDCPLGS
jgi:hypothetical protein